MAEDSAAPGGRPAFNFWNELRHKLNAHESLIALATAQSIGQFFVFEPELYRKGTGTRQPADLALHYDGVIFLFHAYSGKHSGFEHNFNQQVGWLRAWRGGQRLQGRNPWREFDLGYNDIDHIVLLSVSDGSDSLNCFRREETRGLSKGYEKIALVASITSPFLSGITQTLGGMREFVRELIGLFVFPNFEREELLVRRLHENFEYDKQGSFSDRLNLHDDRVIQRLDQVMRYAHNPPFEAITNPRAIQPFIDTFSDMLRKDRLDEAHLIEVLIKECRTNIASGRPDIASMGFAIGKEKTALAVVSSGIVAEFEAFKGLEEMRDKLRAEGHNVPHCASYHLEFGEPCGMHVCDHRPGQSKARSELEGWRRKAA